MSGSSIGFGGSATGFLGYLNGGGGVSTLHGSNIQRLPNLSSFDLSGATVFEMPGHNVYTRSITIDSRTVANERLDGSGFDVFSTDTRTFAHSGGGHNQAGFGASLTADLIFFFDAPKTPLRRFGQIRNKWKNVQKGVKNPFRLGGNTK